ncbi:uncharacterized protein LOC113371621 [Ctenocephalides felis]|uniref:uncharacterized protein LOC113371621 n=1 Tax=Ctenocephalides felis TaxID=7515 RepID=UPI000E6E14F9|nr:uncharacterized protein LOC113371621 [Ctenocephalides felis]
MYRNPKYYFLLLTLFIHFELIKGAAERIVFSFPEFQYKESSRNELIFREFESACEQSSRCSHLTNIAARQRCIRECVSPSCYEDIYTQDQLEDGEIDVRLNSFKGCFIQRSGRPRT